MPLRRTLLEDDEDVVMAGAFTVSGSPQVPSSSNSSCVRHWLNVRHVPDILRAGRGPRRPPRPHPQAGTPNRFLITVWVAASVDEYVIILFASRGLFFRRIPSRRCVGIPTRPRQSTRGSCSCGADRSRTCHMLSALLSVRGCTTYPETY